jgi:hypothetical protein
MASKTIIEAHTVQKPTISVKVGRRVYHINDAVEQIEDRANVRFVFEMKFTARMRV